MKRSISCALALFLLANFFITPVSASDQTMDEYRGFDFLYEGLSIVRNEDGLLGYADETGKIIIPCKFEDAYPFKYGIALVQLDGKKGFIDKSGEFVIQPKYDHFIYQIAVAGDTKTFLDIVYFENGPMPFSIFEMDEMGGITSMRYGLLDRSGKEILPPIYTAIDLFRNGVSIVEKKSVFGAVDIDGNFIVPLQYDEIKLFEFRATVLFAVRTGDQWSLLNDRGEAITQETYDDIGLYGVTEGYIAVKKGGSWGFISATGKESTPFVYDEVGQFNQGAANVRIGDKWGIVDTAGRDLTPMIYDAVDNSPYSPGGIKVCKDGKWGCLNYLGEVIVPTDYDYVWGDSANGLIFVSKDQKYGYLSPSGEPVIPIIYDGSADRIPGAYAMMRDGKFGIMDTGGSLVTPFEYDECDRMQSVLFKLRKGDLWGCVDASGKTIIPFEYEEISYIQSNAVIAKKDGYYGALSFENKVIIPFEYNFSLTPFDSTGVSRAAHLTRSDEPITWDNILKFFDFTYFTHPDFIPSEWAADQVQKAYQNWIVPYYFRGYYTQEISRAEFCLLATFLIQAKTGQSYKNTVVPQHFIDTDYDYVSAMANLGIVSGISEDQFDPDSSITREQAAVMLKRVAEYLGMELKESVSVYADSDEISPWAVDAVKIATGGNILDGTGDNKFAPKGLFTREQAIVTMLRLFSAT